MRGFVILAAALAVALPASADPADFPRCDGYPAPRKKNDGITTASGFLGIGTQTVDMRRGSAAPGKAGIAACEAALADPALLDAHWLRRAHLLQAKALHQIAARGFDDALATLAESDAMGGAHASPLFDLSVGLGNLALRGLALYRLGRRDEAVRTLAAANAARPYSVSVRRLTRDIRLAFEAGRDTQMALMRADAPFDASLMHPLFWSALLNDDFAGALGYAREVTFDLPRNRGAWRLEGEATRQYALIEERARFDGAVAYALLATGRADAAAARMAAARQDLEDAQTPPEPDSRGRISKRDKADYDARVAAAGRADALLDIWELSIAMRKRVAGMALAQAMELLLREENKGIPVITDVLRQAKATNSFEAARLKATVELVDREKDRARQEGLRLDDYELARMLPRPEVDGMRPRLGTTGFSIREARDGDTADIAYGSDKASSALVEEAAFLAAANYARDKGADSFVIVTGQLIQRTLTVYGYYYSSSSSVPSGYEMRLVVRPVRAASLPDGLKDSGWRLMKVADVRARLAEKFAAVEKH